MLGNREIVIIDDVEIISIDFGFEQIFGSGEPRTISCNSLIVDNLIQEQEPNQIFSRWYKDSHEISGVFFFLSLTYK